MWIRAGDRQRRERLSPVTADEQHHLRARLAPPARWRLDLAGDVEGARLVEDRVAERVAVVHQHAGEVAGDDRLQVHRLPPPAAAVPERADGVDPRVALRIQCHVAHFDLPGRILLARGVARGADEDRRAVPEHRRLEGRAVDRLPGFSAVAAPHVADSLVGPLGRMVAKKLERVMQGSVVAHGEGLVVLRVGVPGGVVTRGGAGHLARWTPRAIHSHARVHRPGQAPHAVRLSPIPTEREVQRVSGVEDQRGIREVPPRVELRHGRPRAGVMRPERLAKAERLLPVRAKHRVQEASAVDGQGRPGMIVLPGAEDGGRGPGPGLDVVGGDARIAVDIQPAGEDLAAPRDDLVALVIGGRHRRTIGGENPAFLDHDRRSTGLSRDRRHGQQPEEHCHRSRRDRVVHRRVLHFPRHQPPSTNRQGRPGGGASRRHSGSRS